MNIREFSNAVGLIALNYPTVQEYNEGDIYNYLNVNSHLYPCIFLTIESVEEGELNSQTLTGSLFYVDRLLNDSSNRLMVQTAAISTLKILTGKINDNISGEMEVVSYQPFTEKFADWCAGAFCEFSFTYITGSECGEYDELALTVKENGVYDILGYEKIVVSVPQEGVSAQWVRDYTYSKKESDDKLAQKADKTEIPSLTGYATELWVQNQGYLTEHQPLKTINGQSIVGEGNIEIEGGSGVTIEQVDTEIDSKLTGYATKEELNSKADKQALLPIEGRIGALNQIVQNKADKSEIPSLEGYATEIWVQNQGYLTEHQSLENYATKDELAQKADLSYVNAKLSGKVNNTDIWTGTEAEWNALTQEQKASYTIALVR